MKKVYFFFLAFICLWACEKTPEEIAVTLVTLSQPTAEMIEGETAQLIATVLPSDATDKKVIWASSKQSVATVSNTGLVSAIAEGTSTITASAGGKSATCTVTVSKKVIEVSSVELNKTTLELVEGDSETLIATVKPDDATDKAITWNSSNTDIASVDVNGNVTAIKEGTATVTAKAGDKQTSCSVSVAKRVIDVESITLNKAEVSLEKGKSETLIATVKPDNATDKTVTWSSSDDGIVSVDQSGKVTAIKGGKATITASAGNKSAKCGVTVTVPVESVSLDRTSITLEEEQSTTLVATVKPDDATNKDIIWSSDKPSVASVDSNGKVTGISTGNATITVKTSDGGFTAQCFVTVIAVGYVDLGLSVKWATCNLGASSPEENGDYYAWGEIEKKDNYTLDTYKWYDSANQTYIKYNDQARFGPTDNKIVLDPEDDVAHVILGGAWRMPTRREMNELWDPNNCNWELTTLNGVTGCKVTSRKEGFTNNWVFFPLAGEMQGSTLKDEGTSGWYWSSTLASPDTKFAFYLYVNKGWPHLYHSGRETGGSIRPVKK